MTPRKPSKPAENAKTAKDAKDAKDAKETNTRVPARKSAARAGSHRPSPAKPADASPEPAVPAIDDADPREADPAVQRKGVGKGKPKGFKPRHETPQVPDPPRAAGLLAAREASRQAFFAAGEPLRTQRDPLARGFTLASLNCCGIRSAERRGLLAWLKRTRPDIACLQEVRAWPDQIEPELRCPAGYNTRWLVAGRKGYSGVATYSRASPDRYEEGSGLWWGDDEARVLRADFGDLSIVNLYSPSGSSSPDRQILKFSYLEHLADFARWLLAENRPIALCGDFNIAHTALDIRNATGNARNSGFLAAERQWFTELLALGWVDVLRTLHPGEPDLYSWWSNRGQARAKDVGWRIDYVLASPSLAALAQESWIEKRAGLSDHAPVWVRFGPRPAGSPAAPTC
ncbi:MAG TPA: exodeoxyribonuclease III [Planctomycetota bacterium]|nr:exodeoxyribonuclease III [Planctomycetota bacterium]